MITVTRTLNVAASAPDVVAYLRDFEHATAWDDGTISCEKIGDEPIGVGTRFRNVSKFAGSTTELVYTLTDDRPDHLRFEGSNRTASTADDLTVRATSSGSTLDYRADVRFHGAAALLTPVLRVAFERLADRTERQLQTVLDSLSAGGDGHP